LIFLTILWKGILNNFVKEGVNSLQPRGPKSST
jgi:hypothetical protein